MSGRMKSEAESNAVFGGEGPSNFGAKGDAVFEVERISNFAAKSDAVFGGERTSNLAAESDAVSEGERISNFAAESDAVSKGERISNFATKCSPKFEIPRAMKSALVFTVVSIIGCSTGSALWRESDSMQAQLNNAREAGAYRCAPKELALAEAELDFMIAELEQGNSVRATEHRNRAETALVKVVDIVKDCPSLIQDRDGDGVPDDSDLCPDTPGVPDLAGCPDADGDGIIDKKDKCPQVPEDMDGNEDEDGCPENEDSDGDGLFDSENKCHELPGDDVHVDIGVAPSWPERQQELSCIVRKRASLRPNISRQWSVSERNRKSDGHHHTKERTCTPRDGAFGTP